MRVVQCSGNVNLAAKAIGAQLTAQLRRQYFYDDLAVQRRLARDKDAAHTAARKLALE